MLCCACWSVAWGGTQTLVCVFACTLEAAAAALTQPGACQPALPTSHCPPHTCSPGACPGTSTGWTLRWMWRAPSTSSTPATSSTSTASRPTSCSGLLVCTCLMRGTRGCGCAISALVAGWCVLGLGESQLALPCNPSFLQHHQPSKAGRRRLGPGAGRAAVPDGRDVPAVACRVGSAAAACEAASVTYRSAAAATKQPLPTLLLPCADPVPLVHHRRWWHLQLGGACLLRGTGGAGTDRRGSGSAASSLPVHARQLLSSATPFSRSTQISHTPHHLLPTNRRRSS